MAKRRPFPPPSPTRRPPPGDADQLSRVGVTGVEKVIRVKVNGEEQLYYAELESLVDLPPEQAGVHMSRFEEVVNEAIDAVVLGEAALRAEALAAHIAERVRESQGGLRAEVSIAARYRRSRRRRSRHADPGDLHAVRNRGRFGRGTRTLDRG